jgi:hypothetical protein
MTPPHDPERRTDMHKQLEEIHLALAAIKVAANGGPKTPAWVKWVGIPSMLAACFAIPLGYHNTVGMPAIREASAAAALATSETIKRELSNPHFWAQVREVARAEAREVALDRAAVNRAAIDDLRAKLSDIEAVVQDDSKLLDRTLRASPPQARP